MSIPTQLKSNVIGIKSVGTLATFGCRGAKDSANFILDMKQSNHYDALLVPSDVSYHIALIVYHVRRR